MPIKTKKPIMQKPDENTLLKKMEIGKYQHSLEFICALGDPSRIEKGKKRGSDTGKATPKIVGAKFRALEPIRIIESPPGEDFLKDLMAYDPDNIKWRTCKAGEILLMTPFEYGVLLSIPEYFNGYVLGGDRPVCLTYTNPRKDKNAMHSVKKLPRVALRPCQANATIKDATIENVLEYSVETVNEVTGQTQKVKKILPGFEKWAPLAENPTGKRGRKPKAKATDPTKEKNPKAVKFISLLGDLVGDSVFDQESEEEFGEID